MSVLFEGEAQKYSLGRSTGISSRGWKTRHVVLTKHTLSYAEKAGADPKLEVPTSALSILFTAPGKAEHPAAAEAGGGPMVVVRLFENGVFNLLIKFNDEGVKRKFVAAMRSGLANNKGFQVV